MALGRIVSGGQTGVDRAALDVALERGIACGGWCPRGRRAEDGAIPGRYPLSETPSAGYRQRTAWNVRDSDATLVLACGELVGGSLLTVREAVRCGKPVRVVDLVAWADAEAVRDWLHTHRVAVLNVAGARESEAPGVHDRAVAFLTLVVSSL